MNNNEMQPMEIPYKKVGDYYLPMFSYPAADRPIGHWGRMRRDYLKPFSKTYLKTLHNQLSCLFNHAVRFYGLGANPAQKAGNMGTEEKKEMLFWTKAEYDKFIEVVMDKPITYYAFEILYWCGLRLGEMLALTPADFDFERGTVSITKSYQRIHGKDVVTPPKTKKSVRVVQMPPFLCDEIQDYIKRLHGAESDTRMVF